MTALEIQILADYEQNGTSPEVIAADIGLELEAVKATLGQYSAKYRDSEKSLVAASPRALLTEDEITEFHEIIKHLARCGETDSIRLKACTRLVDEGKGRLDKRKSVDKIKRDIKINVIQLNDSIRAAREKMLEAIVDVKEIEQG